jgi:hypothetical protein
MNASSIPLLCVMSPPPLCSSRPPVNSITVAHRRVPAPPRHGPYLALRTKPWSWPRLVDADAVVAGPSSHRRRPPQVPPLAEVLPWISSPTPASMTPARWQHGYNPGDPDLLPNCPLFDLDAGETALPTQHRRRCYPHLVVIVLLLRCFTLPLRRWLDGVANATPASLPPFPVL